MKIFIPLNHFINMKKLVLLIILSIAHIYLYSQTYQIEWQGCFGGSDMDVAKDIIEITNGYLIAGASKSDDGDINSGNHGAVDAWLVKLDKQGNLVWEKCYGGTNSEFFTRIFQANEGNFLLLGDSDSSDGDISNDPYPESTDFWIVKIDSLGNILWDRIVGGGILDQIWTGTLTDDGGIVAYGWSGSTDGDVSISYGAYDIWMVKLSSEGEKEWDFTIGTDWFDYGQAAIQTSDGGFLCGGACAIGEGGNLTCDPFNYNAEAILVKLDKDRNIEWQQCYGGSDHDGITALIETTDGYIFGAYVNSNDGDISGWHGGNDIWIVKTDLLGNIIWQNPLGGSHSEFTSKLMCDDNGNIIVFGTTLSQDGDVTGNHSQSTDYYDIWMIKVSSDGELLSQQCFGGKSSEMMDFGVVKKSDYNFVIAGQTEWGPSYDVQCTPHSLPVEDFWVFEIQDTLTSVVESNEIIGEIKVYPNPADDYVCFEVACGGSDKKMDIKLFNNLGMPVKDPVFYNTNGKIIWDCHKYCQGIYFYSITINTFHKTGIIIKN